MAWKQYIVDFLSKAKFWIFKAKFWLLMGLTNVIFPHKVKMVVGEKFFPNLDDELSKHIDMRHWCLVKCKGMWTFAAYPEINKGPWYQFSSKNDAFLFKLTWGDGL